MTSPLRRIDASLLTQELLKPATSGAQFTRDALHQLEQRLGHVNTTSGELLRIDGWTLRSGLGESQSTFAWNPLFTKRSLGLAALRLLVFGVAATPAEAVSKEVDRLVRLGSDQPSSSRSLASYLASCAPALRAAAMAHAVTYTTEICGALDWKSFDRHPIIGGPDATAILRNQGLLLRGRSEVICDIDRESDGELSESRLVVMPGVLAPETTLLLGAVALTATLASSTGAAPARVVAYFPTSGQAAVLEVTEPILQRSALGIAKRVANCPVAASQAHAA